ncbi:MAG TPA: serine hydrolase domain-containing protein [Anaerolineales bacterium]|nr:serine hydrolase domain-containing protein [Anaerolineales bacterium]
MFTQRTHSFLAILLALFGLSACTELPISQPPIFSEHLRLQESPEAIISELQTFIPKRMVDYGVPGVAVAYIRAGELVWTEGFGVTRSFGGQPVTPGTVFEVASNGKVVTALLALQSVQDGTLALDTSANDYLTSEWLAPSQYRSSITLRQILSHTSGLSNQVSWADGRIAFPPGSDFAYSGIGFNYLQAILEQTSGQSINELAQTRIFTPLGMTHSSFVDNPTWEKQLAYGHLSYGSIFGYLAGPAVLAWLACLVSVLIFWRWLAGWLKKRRIWQAFPTRWRPTFTNAGHWHAPIWQIAMLYAIGMLAGLLIIRRYVYIGRSLALFTALMVSASALLTVFIYKLTTTSFWRWLKARSALIRVGIKVGIAAISLALTGYLMRGVAMPVPVSSYRNARAAFTLRSTAPDLARFLIELARPTLLSNELNQAMRTPQVRLSEDISWGLGAGLQHSDDGTAIWQWGKNIPFDSLMVIYPEQGVGIVVLTNSGNGLDLAREIAHQALGGKAVWQLPE